MQNHLDSAGRTFTSMLPADPFGPPSHDFSSMNNHHHHPGGSPGSDFGHLINSNQNHSSSSNNNTNPLNNNHLHHNNNNHSAGNNNNNNNNNHAGGGGGSDVKPKKAPPPNGKKTKGRVKIKMEFIDNKLRRYTTFSKRKTGIMKKAYELSTLTGTQVMLLVASETGHVYTFATRKLQPMITSEAGKALIQTCLNSPDPPNSGSDTQRMSATGYEETELTYAADPTGSDHGDVKDDEMSETGSSDGEDQKEVPGLLPLSNGFLPPNFAALLATATAAGLGGGGTKGGLTIDSVMGSQGSNHSGSRSGAGNHFPSSTSVTITATSSPSSSHSSSSVSTPSNSSHNSHHHHHHHQQNHNHHHSHHQQSSNKNKSGIKMKRDK